MIAETRPFESRGSKQAVAWRVCIVRPPDFLSPIESRDVCREGHSIDAINVYCRATVQCQKGPVARQRERSEDRPHDAKRM